MKTKNYVAPKTRALDCQTSVLLTGSNEEVGIKDQWYGGPNDDGAPTMGPESKRFFTELN